MGPRASSLIAAAFMAAFVFAAPAAFAAKGKGPPLAGVWNIAPSGRAKSSGDLHFRITRNDGSSPVDVKVPVRAGAEQQTIARNIRNALGSKLRGDRFNVELGAGDNVLQILHGSKGKLCLLHREAGVGCHAAQLIEFEKRGLRREDRFARLALCV